MKIYSDNTTQKTNLKQKVSRSSLESRLSNKKYGSMVRKVSLIDQKMDKVFEQQKT